MKKEILIAIILGLSFGLLITYGVYRTRSAHSPNQTAQLQATPTPSSLESAGNLVLDAPVDESIVDTETITVSGTTDPNQFVVIFLGSDEQVTTSDESGHFSVSLDLETGSNVFTIVSLAEDGSKSQIERTVIYTTQPLESNPTPTASESSDSNEK